MEYEMSGNVNSFDPASWMLLRKYFASATGQNLHYVSNNEESETWTNTYGWVRVTVDKCSLSAKLEWQFDETKTD